MEEAKSLPDFIGFHCQTSERGKFDDDIIGGRDRDYGDYLPQIIDSLHNDLLIEADELGLRWAPEDQYSEEYEEWYDAAMDFLYEKGIRWVFVSQTAFLENYGDYCYALTLPDDAVLDIIPDPWVNDDADAYVYDSNRARPGFMEVEDPEFRRSPF